MQKNQSENKYAPPMRSKKKIGNTASKLENLIKADVQKETVT